MNATEAKLLDFLMRSPQFLVPIHQRTYSWTESECRQRYVMALVRQAFEKQMGNGEAEP